MSRQRVPQRVRAVVLAALMVGSAIAMTATIAGPATAAANSASFDVTEDVTRSDDTITVTGDTGDAGANVTFLIQDPADDDVATVTKSTASTDTSFSVDIDLGSLTFSGGDGSLDEGDASVRASEGDSFDTVEATDTVTIDDTAPTAELETPTDGFNLTAHPSIAGDASDNSGIRSVELTIENSSGRYWNETQQSFVSDKSWVTADTEGSGDDINWSYETGNEGIDQDDTYEVNVKVTDTAGNEQEADYPFPGGDSELAEVSYTVDTTPPEITNVTLTDATDSNGNVEDGDRVKVSADVTDNIAGIDSVTVDATPFGRSANLALENTNGDTWARTFEIDGPTAGEGSVELNVTAEDGFVNTANATTGNSLTLDTSVAGVETLTVEHDFLGVIKDNDSSVTVNATGITDPQGNEVTDAEVDIEVVESGTTYDATVSDGSLETTIDPTAIPNSTDTVNTTVQIKQAGAGAATEGVELVHEVKGLDEGYQMQGTPAPALRTVYEDVDLVTTWDPTEPGTNKWDLTAGKQAGAGYYIHGENDSARFGYVFDTDVPDTERHETRTLYEGYNLVGATENLSTSTEPDLSEDLGSIITFGNSGFDGNANVNVSVRNTSESLSDGGESINEDALDTVSDPANEQISGFDAYFVYVENENATRIVERIGYDTGNRD